MNEQCTKPLQQQSINEIDLFLSQLTCLTYLLLAKSNDCPADTVCTALPTPVAAAAMVDAAFSGNAFKRPYDVAKASGTGTEYSREEVVHQINQRVGELKRRNVSFVFVWHLVGDMDVQWQTSGGKGEFACSWQVIDFLAEEVRDHLDFLDPCDVCDEVVEPSEVDDDLYTPNIT